jgi:hypothetical protein
MKRLYDRRLLPAPGLEPLRRCRLRLRSIHVVAYRKNRGSGLMGQSRGSRRIASHVLVACSVTIKHGLYFCIGSVVRFK